MAIFNRNNNLSTTNVSGKEITTISNGSTFLGDINATCNIHIDGFLKGDILSKFVVSIGEKGKMDGNICSEKVIISGIFNGTIDATYIELASGAYATGEFISNILVIEEGATFEGMAKKRTLNDNVQKEITLNEELQDKEEFLLK